MPQNPFDNLSSRVFERVQETMGYDATWSPSAGGSTKTARVLFGEPTKDDMLGEYADSFNLRTFFMEWWDDSFIGLFDSVRDDGGEYVTITQDSGDRYFYVRHAFKKYDGRNHRAQLEEVDSLP